MQKFSKCRIATTILCLALAMTSAAFAHHSSAMFDKSVIREVAATVIEFQWSNPHVWIQIEIRGDSGEAQEWSIETLGPNSLFRRGWRPNSFQPGDNIQIKFNPMRDGSPAGGFIAAKFPDGSIIGNW